MCRFAFLATLFVNAAAIERSRAEPLEKAISLLKDVRAKVTAGGEAEAKTYETFACFCKDTKASKLSAIETNENEKNTLQGRMNAASNLRDDADVNLGQAIDDIGAANSEIERLTAERHASHLEFQKNEVDLTGAIQAITSAVHALRAAKLSTTSFASLRVLQKSTVVRRALRMLEVFSPQKKKAASIALAALDRASGRHSRAPWEEPDVVYDFHADSVITTLEELKTSFKNQKDTLDSDETTARQTFELALQAQQQIISAKEIAMDENKRTKAQQTSLIVADSQDLTAVSAQLLDDKAYLMDMNSKCAEKAELWDQRSQLRLLEIQSLSEAIRLMESLDADEQPPNFLQTGKPSVVPRRHLRLLRRRNGHTALRSVSQQVRAAAALLHKRGEELRSTDLLRLASEASEDPLGKVKQMIQALVERLLKEAQSEATHKGWCDTQISLAEQTRDSSSETIEEVNGRLAVTVARQEKLSQSVQTLSTELQALNQTLEEARSVRAQERNESAVAIQDAKKLTRCRSRSHPTSKRILRYSSQCEGCVRSERCKTIATVFPRCR
jgi:hypothetical protein